MISTKEDFQRVVVRANKNYEHPIFLIQSWHGIYLYCGEQRHSITYGLFRSLEYSKEIDSFTCYSINIPLLFANAKYPKKEKEAEDSE